MIATCSWRVASSLLVAGIALAAAGAQERRVLTVAGVESTPRIDGSTSAQPLLALVVCRQRGIQCAKRMTFDDAPMTFFPAALADLDAYFKAGKPAASGTGESYRRLIRGETDVIVVARKPSVDEQSLARERRVALRVEQVAWDGLVFIVNAKNSTTGLTLDAIRQIYAGKPLRWSDAGGSGDSRIVPLTRDKESGSQQLFNELVSPVVAPTIVPGRQFYSMAGLVDAVGEGADDLGFSVFYYIGLRPNARVKLLAIDGVTPDRSTIAGGAYPLRSGVFVVIRSAEPPTSPATALFEWMLGPAGQAVVAESGYVPSRVAGK